ncbi:MAG: DsrE family protein [Actinomycetes bacterium]
MATLVLKLTTVEPEKMSQALNVCATALASGAGVSLWLTGDAVRLATPGFAAGIELEQSAPFDQLVDAVRAGGRLTACTQCLGRRNLMQEDLFPGVEIRGASGFVEEILQPAVQALVY